MALAYFYRFALVFILVSCADEEEKVESTHEFDENNQDQSENNSSESFECSKDEDCPTDQPSFLQFPGGFENPICDMGELSKFYGVRCTECLRDQDCLENEVCRDATICVPE